MGDVPSYRDPMPDEGHEALREPLRAAIDDLADAVSLLAENAAGVQDAYFLNDLLFQMMGESLNAAVGVLERIAALEAKRLRGSTSTPVSKSLLLGVVGTVTPYAVTFTTPMDSTNYVPIVTLDSASISLLGSLTWQVTDKTTTGCTVNVRNGALLALAQTVTVTVTAIQLT